LYVFFAREYGFTPDEVNNLRLIPLCVLMGAVTPDHQIEKLVMKDYLRMRSTEQNRILLKEIHGR